MDIYLIRHGRQCSKLCNVDVGLSEEGYRQALLLGKRLAAVGIDAVYSSSLKRAVETARTANQYWKAEYIVKPELKEISFGEMEGLSDETIAVRFADFKTRQTRMEEDLSYPGGESAGDVIKRALPVMYEIARSGCVRAAVVTHGGVIRCLLTALLCMEPAKYRLLGNSLENCSITRLVWHETDRRFTVESFNDRAHLENYPDLLRENWMETEN